MLQLLNRLFKNDILKSSAGLLIITLSVKVFGYIEKLVLANYFGTSYNVDAYTSVLTIVLSIFLLAREIIEPGFLNVFLDTKNKGNESVSWNLFNKGLRLILIITVILSLMAFFFPEGFAKIFAPGFEGETLALTQKLIKIAVPACIFLALSTLTNITLNGLKIFALPASGELVFKGMIIVCMVFFYKQYGIVGAAAGIVIGSVGRLLVHLTKLHKKISFRKIKIENNYKQRIWQLTWPLLLGVGFSIASSLIDNVFGSYMQEGAIAALSYAKKVVELPVIIFPYVISIVVFPYFSQLAIEKQEGKLKDLLVDSLKWIVIAFLPVAAFFYIFSTPIVEIIFQRGAFNANSTLLTSKPLMIYSIGMLFFAIETILVIFYYANADTKTPVFIGMACVILNILLTWIFIQYIGYIGIALAFVIQKVVKNLILLYLVRQKISYSMRNFWMFFSKALLSFAVFIILISVGKSFMYDEFNQTLIGKMGFIASSFTIAGLVYLFILYWMGLISIKSTVRA